MSTSLATSIQYTLDSYGTALLREPRRFVSALLDVCDEQEMVVSALVYNCDAELLKPFVQAVFYQPVTTDGLQNAAVKASIILQYKRGLSYENANQVAGQLMLGIARHLKTSGTSNEYPPGPNKESGRKANLQKKTQEDTSNATPTNVTSTTPTSQDPIAEEKTRETPERKHGCLFIGGVIVAVLTAYFIIAIAVGNFSSNTFTFEGGEDATGTMSSIKANQGEQVTLPECKYQRDGYVFNQWESASGELYDPGDKVEAITNTTFTATWAPATITVSFVSSDSASGSTDAISCAWDEEIVLPECGFKRKYHTFKHWCYGTSTYDPGDTIRLQESATITAAWELDPSQCFTVTREFKSLSDEEELFIALTVRNDFEETLDFTANFEFFDAKKKSTGKHKVKTYSIAPNETAFLYSSAEAADRNWTDHKPTDATYELEIDSAPLYGDGSAASLVTVKEISCTYERLTAEITNDGNNDVYLQGMVAFSKSDTNSFMLSSEGIGETLAPGQSRTVEFDLEGWTYFDDRELYVYGHVA